MSLARNSITRQSRVKGRTSATKTTLLLALLVSLIPQSIVSQNSSHAASIRTELIWSFETGG